MAQREKNLGCVQSELSIMFGLNLCDQILNNRKKFPADCLNMVEYLQKKKSYLSLIFGFSLKKVMVIMYPMLKARDLTCRSVFKRLRTHQEKERQGEITVERRALLIMIRVACIIGRLIKINRIYCEVLSINIFFV